MAQKIIDVPGFGPTAFPDSMSDDEIVTAIQRQHPDLAPKTEAPPSFVSQVGRAIGPTLDLAIGGGKELGSTAWNLLKGYQKNNAAPELPERPGMTRMDQPMIRLGDKKPDYLEPSNTLQKVGGAGATMAEFATGSELAKLPKAGILANSLAQALAAGGVGKARGESPKQAMVDALMSGGTTAVVGGLSKAAGPFGERIEAALLKPLKADLQDVKGPPELATQTMVKNLFKYDLGGTLENSFQKASAKTADLGQQLRAAMGSNPSATIDMNQLLKDTAVELGGNASKNFGINSAIKKSLIAMADEVSSISGNGQVNLADAQEMKQALGAMGSWNHGMRDAESTATETVANTLYSKMRAAIENASGQSAQVKEINRQFGEIIPIKNAILRRIPVAARREPISLKEAIALATGNLKGVSLAITDRALRSGTIANALVQSGKAPVSAGGGIGGPTTGLARALQDYAQRNTK